MIQFKYFISFIKILSQFLIRNFKDYNPDIENDHNRKGRKSALDPNHTHFILVDDGTKEGKKADIIFRSELENELKGSKSFFSDDSYQTLTEDTNNIPLILIVIQGGDGTIDTIVNSIDKNIPVLVLAVN